MTDVIDVRSDRTAEHTAFSNQLIGVIIAACANQAYVIPVVA